MKSKQQHSGSSHQKMLANFNFKQRYYPVSPLVQKHIDEKLDKMLELGIVEKSNSSSIPILMVKKKKYGYRFCVDFRKLNRVTKPDA